MLMRGPAPTCQARAEVSRRPSAGMAALTVVMGIFFVMALVAAYTNRNLIFEQRTSANSYRAERAVTAADAAADWALAMLNTGRVDDQCVPSTDLADADFRSRYLTLDPDTGGYALKSVSKAPFYAGCLTTRGEQPQLVCACPTVDKPNLGLDPPAGYVATGFRVAFGIENGRTYTPPGVLTLQLRGCANSGVGSTACQSKSTTPDVDAVSLVEAHVGLLRALPAAPLATLTAGQAATATSALKIVNTDPATGITVHTGGAATLPASSFTLPAGTPGDGIAQTDAKLKAVADGARSFENTFGMSADLYKKQPAVVLIKCPAGCKLSDLTDANWLNGYPGRTLFVDGDLSLDTALASAAVGSATTPVMLVVAGDLLWSARMDLTGFVYANNIKITGAGANSTVSGAVMAAQAFSADVPATLAYDAAALNLVVKGFGSFIRVPGGWNRGTK